MLPQIQASDSTPAVPPLHIYICFCFSLAFSTNPMDESTTAQATPLRAPLLSSTHTSERLPKNIERLSAMALCAVYQHNLCRHTRVSAHRRSPMRNARPPCPQRNSNNLICTTHGASQRMSNAYASLARWRDGPRCPPYNMTLRHHLT